MAIDPTGEFEIRARNRNIGLTGQEDWVFWFDFTSRCLIEKEGPAKGLVRFGRWIGKVIPDKFSGENDVDAGLVCECKEFEAGLRVFFEDQQYEASDISSFATEFGRADAAKVLTDLRAEFRRLVNRKYPGGNEALVQAYPWARLLDNAQERSLGRPRDLVEENARSNHD